MSSPNSTQRSSLLPELRRTVSGVIYKPASGFSWSAQDGVVYYSKSALQTPQGQWALLHETGHALLQHQGYDSDFDLLLKEVAAWEKAKILGTTIGIQIEEDHIQDCLDTYRDWLHNRSTCPRCGVRCVQSSSFEYTCHNCNCIWQVSASRFCRAYRLTKT